MKISSLDSLLGFQVYCDWQFAGISTYCWGIPEQ